MCEWVLQEHLFLDPISFLHVDTMYFENHLLHVVYMFVPCTDARCFATISCNHFCILDILTRYNAAMFCILSVVCRIGIS